MVALLSGGDYSTGLHGCGPKIAYGIAQYGLGRNLIWACQNYPDSQLAMYLSDVRHELRHLLRADPLGLIGRRCPVLADNVAESFPSIQVLRDYAEPLTSWSRGQNGVAAIPTVDFNEADLSGLALFCSQRLGWVPSVVHDKFEIYMWPGACLRSISLTPWMAEGLVTRKILSGSGRTVKMYRINIIGDGILALVEDGISQAHGSRPRGLSKRSSVWIPLPIIRHSVPHLVKPDDQLPSVPAPSTIASLPSDVIDLTGDDDIEVAGRQ